MKLKLLKLMILFLAIANAELPIEFQKEIKNLTNDIRKLEYARRAIAFISCDGLVALPTEEDNTIFKYRNDIFKSLFCDQPELRDTLFFRMIYFYNHSLWTYDSVGKYWQQEWEKERRKKRAVIVSSAVVVTLSIVGNVFLIRSLIR